MCKRNNNQIFFIYVNSYLIFIGNLGDIEKFVILKPSEDQVILVWRKNISFA